ncbi:MAG: hypothetical protein ACR2JC_09940 [Chloroflexota bacterium]|nr:MAG: hypothetical protein DLM70_12585 [Chloroflexota bacterium]
MSATPITTSQTPAAGRQPSTPSTSTTFQRAAGIAGLLTVATGVAAQIGAGSQPGLGASSAKVATYFAANSSAHKAYVVLAALIALPIAVYMVGVYQTLATADRSRNTSWSTLFLYGAVMLSATAGFAESLYAVLALRGGSGLDPNTLRAFNDGAQITNATLGVWIAVAVGSVAAATFQHRIRSRWYGWFCTLAAVLGVLAVIDTVSGRRAPGRFPPTPCSPYAQSSPPSGDNSE